MMTMQKGYYLNGNIRRLKTRYLNRIAVVLIVLLSFLGPGSIAQAEGYKGPEQNNVGNFTFDSYRSFDTPGFDSRRDRDTSWAANHRGILEYRGEIAGNSFRDWSIAEQNRHSTGTIFKDAANHFISTFNPYSYPGHDFNNFNNSTPGSSSSFSNFSNNYSNHEMIMRHPAMSQYQENEGSAMRKWQKAETVQFTKRTAFANGIRLLGSLVPGLDSFVGSWLINEVADRSANDFFRNPGEVSTRFPINASWQDPYMTTNVTGWRKETVRGEMAPVDLPGINIFRNMPVAGDVIKSITPERFTGNTTIQESSHVETIFRSSNSSFEGHSVFNKYDNNLPNRVSFSGFDQAQRRSIGENISNASLVPQNHNYLQHTPSNNVNYRSTFNNIPNHSYNSNLNHNSQLNNFSNFNNHSHTGGTNNFNHSHTGSFNNFRP